MQTNQTGKTDLTRATRATGTTSNTGTTFGQGTSLFGFINFAPAPIITLSSTYYRSIVTPRNETLVDPRDGDARKQALIFERLRRDLPVLSPRHRKIMV